MTNDWKCCASKPPSKETPVLIRKKHSKALIGIFEICEQTHQYVLCTDDELALAHTDSSYEWCYTEDL